MLALLCCQALTLGERSGSFEGTDRGKNEKFDRFYLRRIRLVPVFDRTDFMLIPIPNYIISYFNTKVNNIHKILFTFKLDMNFNTFDVK